LSRSSSRVRIGTDADSDGLRGGDSGYSAHLRFRYEPTLHLSESVQIRTQLDLLDNLVLGSTPDGAGGRADVPLVFFSDSQASPGAGGQALADSLAVKAVYAWWSLPLGELTVGRMPDAWGLGMVNNAGQGEDDDFGDYRDRVQFLTQFMGIYAQASLDWISEGATTASPDQPFGQARDLDQLDDADQWTFSVFRRPRSEQELAVRLKDLDEYRLPVFDYGLRFSYRSQEWSSEQQNLPGSQSRQLVPLPELTAQAQAAFDAYDYALVRRDATLYMPDLWLRFEWKPVRQHYLRFELESALGFGTIGESTIDPQQELETERDILLFGLAAEAQYRYRSFDFGLQAGLATGDRRTGFGVLAGSRLPDAESTEDLGAFFFDRDYHVGSILFREILGTVTNAWYLAPSFEYDFIDTAGERLGAKASLLFARALEADVEESGEQRIPVTYGTPSGEHNLGVELGAGLFFTQKDSFTLRLDYGVLFPMDAFSYYHRDTQELIEPERAHTLQGRLVFHF